MTGDRTFEGLGEFLGAVAVYFYLPLALWNGVVLIAVDHCARRFKWNIDKDLIFSVSAILAIFLPALPLPVWAIIKIYENPIEYFRVVADFSEIIEITAPIWIISLPFSIIYLAFLFRARKLCTCRWVYLVLNFSIILNIFYFVYLMDDMS